MAKRKTREAVGSKRRTRTAFCGAFLFAWCTAVALEGIDKAPFSPMRSVCAPPTALRCAAPVRSLSSALSGASPCASSALSSSPSSVASPSDNCNEPDPRPISKGFALGVPPSAPFAGTEVVTNVAFTVRDDIRVFDLALALAASSSNAVEIAFGTDRNANGVLDRPERRFAVGWNGGDWFHSGYSSDAVVNAPFASGDRILNWHLNLNADRRPRRRGLAATDGEVAVFGPQTSPGMFDPDWNLARIVVRGDGDILGSASFALSPVGFSVIVR